MLENSLSHNIKTNGRVKTDFYVPLSYDYLHARLNPLKEKYVTS